MLKVKHSPQEPREHLEPTPAEHPPTGSSTQRCATTSHCQTPLSSHCPPQGSPKCHCFPAIPHWPLGTCSLLLICLPKPWHKQHFQQDLHRQKAAKLCLERVYILRKILLMFTYWTSSSNSYIGKQVLFIGLVICRMHLAFYSLFRDIFLLVSFSSVTITHNYKTLFLYLPLQSFLQGLNKASLQVHSYSAFFLSYLRR